MLSFKRGSFKDCNFIFSQVQFEIYKIFRSECLGCFRKCFKYNIYSNIRVCKASTPISIGKQNALAQCILLGGSKTCT